ncbi:MAG: DUF4351 domain-containing protein [Steroidobacteraceae bacterium]|nr:DUF4351 domain-containing protein [Steroidobacteraceae bacterium]MCW5572032.1 DUF4351 domain-containing protein [Steroidobacteraceae bacterium]
MPSYLHEALVQLFRNRPELAPELLRDALQGQLPAYTEVRIESADLTDVQPAEYRADLVVLLINGKPVLGIIVEIQISADERKRYAWPAYVAALRARLECPACLMVVAGNDSVARWAARSIDMGVHGRFVPLVVGPTAVPRIMDTGRARADPELAVLSAMAHGQDPDIHTSVQIALAAQIASAGLDADRSILYVDLILASLSKAARRELQAMKPAGYEFQSEFARRFVAQGEVAGERRGRAALLIRLLTLRFGPLTDEGQQRLSQASSEELDAIGERVLTARTLEEALGLH